MRTNILPGNVRDELPVPVWFVVQYEGSLLVLIPRPEPPATEE